MQNTIRSWVEDHSNMLFQYARARVPNRSDAEDLVQETFLAAFKSQNFAGRSAPSTYLIGILKHKIMDHFRKVYRNQPPKSDDSTGEQFASLFTPQGTWKEPVADWGNTPEHTLLDKEFNQVLDECLDKLPDQQRTAFVLRTMEDCTSQEVCNNCHISTTHLGVLLFRARTQLKNCLEVNWFVRKGVLP